ncbi:MAG: inositol 2-dehydrogenase [Spirochaetes bacterium]|nr:inositol 2-dehydrogenase [Spirochaetota bacterium]
MKKIKIGTVGLGRLGLKHAENVAFKIPQAELTAVCALEKDRVEKVQKEWKIPNGYTDFDEMLKNKDLDAILIASSSGQHCEQLSKALNAGFHVFVEKPLGINLEECKMAEKAVEDNPDKIFMLGFMRRYDPSYQYAKQKVKEGYIGRPILFRGYSVDPESCIEGAIQFAPTSGGQFIDMAVHDIDLARWFLESDPQSIYAIGGCYAHPEFGKYQDGDNVSALMKFKNEAMAFLLAGRTAPHGYNVETEIIGTKGTLRIANVPQKNLVELVGNDGVVKECSQNFIERFEQAFVNELNEFVSCILKNKKPEVTVYDGTACTEIAFAATEAFKSGQLAQL